MFLSLMRGISCFCFCFSGARLPLHGGRSTRWFVLSESTGRGPVYGHPISDRPQTGHRDDCVGVSSLL